MVLVPVLNIAQNLQSFVCCCRLDDNLLETPFECTVFLNALTVFIERRGTDALYCSPGKRWFQYIGCIHRAWSRAGTDDSVYLVDENNDVRILFNLFYQRTDTFFKLSAIFRSGHDGS